jgi:hypothetical protein
MHITFYSERLKATEYLEDLGVNDRDEFKEIGRQKLD